MKTGFLYFLVFIACFGILEVYILHGLIDGLMIRPFNKITFPRQDMIGGKQIPFGQGGYYHPYQPQEPEGWKYKPSREEIDMEYYRRTEPSLRKGINEPNNRS